MAQNPQHAQHSKPASELRPANPYWVPSGNPTGAPDDLPSACSARETFLHLPSQLLGRERTFVKPHLLTHCSLLLLTAQHANTSLVITRSHPDPRQHKEPLVVRKLHFQTRLSTRIFTAKSVGSLDSGGLTRTTHHHCTYTTCASLTLPCTTFPISPPTAHSPNESLSWSRSSP